MYQTNSSFYPDTLTNNLIQHAITAQPNPAMIPKNTTNMNMAPGMGQMQMPGYGYGYNPGMGGYNPMMGMGVYNPGMMGMGMMEMNPGMMQQEQPPATINYITGPIEGVPPGLEVLFQSDQLFVRQTVEIMERYYNAANKYQVLDSFGRRIYLGVETTDFWTRQCCGCGCAEFELKVLNFYGQDVMTMTGRPGCCCGAQMKLAYGDTVLGTAHELTTCCTLKYEIRNASGVVEFIVVGPEAYGFCGEISTESAVFTLYLPDGVTPVGRISKEWAGLDQELFTDADNFGISFPGGLRTELKAVLLGMAFLLDFHIYDGGAQIIRNTSYDRLHGLDDGRRRRGPRAAMWTWFYVLLVFVVVIIVSVVTTVTMMK